MRGKPAVLFLDAFFLSKTILMTAVQYREKNGQALFSVIMQAKPFAVVYREKAPIREEGNP
jgi:hypothetical protein